VKASQLFGAMKPIENRVGMEAKAMSRLLEGKPRLQIDLQGSQKLWMGLEGSQEPQ